MNWTEPLDLVEVRSVLENDPSTLNAVPGNLCLVGIISGFRILQTDPDFREIFFEVSQGYNDELKLHYLGKFES